jgi:hypothetical protein
LLAIGLIAQSVAEPALALNARAVAAAPSALEQFYNPFGDPWELKKPANPDVPVTLTPACHRYEPKRSSGAPSSDEINWVSKSNSRLVIEECAELPDVNDGQGAVLLKPYIAALKSHDPTVRFIGNFTAGTLPTGVISGASVSDGAPIGLTYIDANQESWFLHQKGQPATKQYRVRDISGFAVMLDMTNPALRQYLATELAKSMAFHQVDGVGIDGCYDIPQYDKTIPGNVPTDAAMSNWADGCANFLADVKNAAPSKLILTYNYWSLIGLTSPDHETYDFNWFARRLDLSDGLLWEDPIGLNGYPSDVVQTSIERLASRIGYAQARNKYLGVIVNTNVGNQSTFSTTNADQQRAYADYYFAAYLTVLEGQRTLMIPYTPVASGDQFHSAAFFKQWDFNVGRPTGPRQNLAEGVYRRDFENARVFLNGSTSPLQASLDDGLWVNAAGAAVTSATIPGRAGAIFLRPATSGACSPRPPVRLTTKTLGPGAVQVQIDAGLGDIRHLDVGVASNTLISVQGGPQQLSGNQSIDMPAGSHSAVVTLQRASGGGGVFAQFNVVDYCGVWKTFAGRGS